MLCDAVCRVSMLWVKRWVSWQCSLKRELPFSTRSDEAGAGEKRAAEEELIKLPLEVPVPTEHGHVFSHIHAGNIIG